MACFSYGINLFLTSYWTSRQTEPWSEQWECPSIGSCNGHRLPHPLAGTAPVPCQLICSKFWSVLVFKVQGNPAERPITPSTHRCRSWSSRAKHRRAQQLEFPEISSSLCIQQPFPGRHYNSLKRPSVDILSLIKTSVEVAGEKQGGETHPDINSSIRGHPSKYFP